LIDDPFSPSTPVSKIDIDLIVISKSPRLQITDLAKIFNCKTIVFDASNSLWKIDKWKEDCDKLNLRHYSIPEQGAFVMDIE